jgi:hypothetical protein
MPEASMIDLLFGGYTFEQEYAWKAERDRLREQENWDAYFRLVIDKTLERIEK